MLQISEGSEGSGFEGYMVKDISELADGNPWNEDTEISELPVFENPYYYEEDYHLTKSEVRKAEKFAEEMADRLGRDNVTISNNAPDENEMKNLEQKFADMGMDVPEEQFMPTEVTAENSDLTIGTMETNFIDNEFSGVGKYNSPIEFLTATKNSGVNLVSVAHNHELDYGIDGLNTTVQKIQDAGLSVTGVKNNTENENKEFTGLIKDVNGIKIAFLGYTYGLSNEQELSDEEKSMANIYTEELAKKDIEYAKENSNFIIVMMR